LNSIIDSKNKFIEEKINIKLTIEELDYLKQYAHVVLTVLRYVEYGINIGAE
jgi:hypothetical protein